MREFLRRLIPHIQRLLALILCTAAISKTFAVADVCIIARNSSEISGGIFIQLCLCIIEAAIGIFLFLHPLSLLPNAIALALFMFFVVYGLMAKMDCNCFGNFQIQKIYLTGFSIAGMLSSTIILLIGVKSPLVKEDRLKLDRELFVVGSSAFFIITIGICIWFAMDELKFRYQVTGSPLVVGIIRHGGVQAFPFVRICNRGNETITIYGHATTCKQKFRMQTSVAILPNQTIEAPLLAPQQSARFGLCLFISGNSGDGQSVERYCVSVPVFR